MAQMGIQSWRHQLRTCIGHDLITLAAMLQHPGLHAQCRRRPVVQTYSLEFFWPGKQKEAIIGHAIPTDHYINND